MGDEGGKSEGKKKTAGKAEKSSEGQDSKKKDTNEGVKKFDKQVYARSSRMFLSREERYAIEILAVRGNSLVSCKMCSRMIPRRGSEMREEEDEMALIMVVRSLEASIP
jgi:hypothetical protein